MVRRDNRDWVPTGPAVEFSGGLDEGFPEVLAEFTAGVELVHGDAIDVAAEQQGLDFGEPGLDGGEVGKGSVGQCPQP